MVLRANWPQRLGTVPWKGSVIAMCSHVRDTWVTLREVPGPRCPTDMHGSPAIWLPTHGVITTSSPPPRPTTRRHSQGLAWTQSGSPACFAAGRLLLHDQPVPGGDRHAVLRDEAAGEPADA
jgi:hypothetical protein